MIALRALDPPADRPLLERLGEAALELVWPLAPAALDIARHGLVAEEDGAGLGVVVLDPAGSIRLLLVDPAHQRGGSGPGCWTARWSASASSGRPRWRWERRGRLPLAGGAGQPAGRGRNSSCLEYLRSPNTR